MRKNKVSGFTLIELLVVITIIGILAVGGVSVYTQQMAKARDSTRVRDIKTLQTAIESSFSDKNSYVTSVAGDSTSGQFIQTIKGYAGAQGIPSDPKNGGSVCLGGSTDLCVYTYKNNTSDNSLTYYLSTSFEVKNALATSDKIPSTHSVNDERMEIYGGKGTAFSSTAKSVTTTSVCDNASDGSLLNINGC